MEPVPLAIPPCSLAGLAGVAESVDAADLKSVAPDGACGFDSRPRHQIRYEIGPGVECTRAYLFNILSFAQKLA